jgi:hypothetical protein
MKPSEVAIKLVRFTIGVDPENPSRILIATAGARSRR